MLQARPPEHWQVRDTESARERLAELAALEQFLPGCSDDWVPSFPPPDLTEADETRRVEILRHWIAQNRLFFLRLAGFAHTAFDDVRSKLNLVIQGEELS